MTATQASSSRQPARIGYLLKTYPRFSQTFVVNEILELERQGADVRIVSMLRPGEGIFHESISRVRARTYYLPETVSGHVRKTWAAHAGLLRSVPGQYLRSLGCVLRQSGADFSDLMQAGHLLRWVGKHRVDHVHVHFGTHEATVALLAHWLGGLSYSMTLHAFDIFRDNVDRALLARKIESSRFTITVSQYNRRHLIEMLTGVTPEKILVRYNGIDLERFGGGTSARRDNTILGVGRLIEKKGFGELVRAVGRLRAAGVPAICKIVGDGPEESALRKEIKRGKLADSVELTGPLPQQEVRRLLQESACFALPCVQAKDGNIDALPTVLLEALAAGCPCVSTRLSGIPEIIEDRVSGLLVEPGDDKGLAEAIGEVLTTPSLARTLAESGLARAADRFDIRRNVRAVHDCLLQAVRGEISGQGPADHVDPAASMSLVHA